ncbi:hypothetical protein [Sulfitobacter geojensis]|uniref:hypothetical protein n=1 Tax=Sulfitobacter geojensis TaxID=1342299 RepID=UPI003BABC837
MCKSVKKGIRQYPSAGRHNQQLCAGNDDRNPLISRIDKRASRISTPEPARFIALPDSHPQQIQRPLGRKVISAEFDVFKGKIAVTFRTATQLQNVELCSAQRHCGLPNLFLTLTQDRVVRPREKGTDCNE